MKKLIFVVTIVLLGLISVCNIETKNLTIQEVISIAQTYVNDNNKEKFITTITNFDSPIVEVVYIDRLVTHNKEKEIVIRNKECYKVTFNYPLELFTGPYDVYVNCSTGKCYGSPRTC